MEGITLLIVVSAAIGGIFILITALSYLFSYTHLTLPAERGVVSSGGGVGV